MSNYSDTNLHTHADHAHDLQGVDQAVNEAVHVHDDGGILHRLAI